MKVLVTGATGFIGRHLAEALVQRGQEVRALVRSSSQTAHLQSLGIELHEGDIAEATAVETAVRGCQQVYHLAGLPGRSHASRALLHQTNVEGTKVVAQAVLKYGVDRLIHGSSAGIYGWIKRPPVTESTPPSPNTPYRTSKWQAEQALWHYHRQDGLPVVVARLSSIYGPHTTNWLGLIRAIARKNFGLVGSGRNHNHLTYVSDVVEGLRCCSEVPGIEGRCYLLAGAEPIQIRHMVGMIADCLGVTLSRRQVPIQPYWVLGTIADFVYQRLGWEVPQAHRYDLFLNDRILNITRAQQELGYTPQISIAAGLKQTIQWFQDNGKL